MVREGVLRILRRAALGAGAVALALTAYVSAVDNPFVGTDLVRILYNPSLGDVRDVASVLRYDPFHPVVNLSYALDRALWGFTSFGFHVSSIVLHAVAVALFYGWCTRAFADAHRGEERLAPDWPAFAAAALFGVHPLMSEAVGYVSARSEVLCSIGFIAALILARRAMQSGSRVSAAAAVLAALFALAAKETGLVLPIVLLAYDAWVLSPSEAARGADGDAWKRRLRVVYIPAIIALAAAAVIRTRTLGPLVDSTGRGVIDNLLTESIVVWRYVGMLVLPHGQTIMHEARVVTSPFDPVALLAAFGLAGVAVMAWWAPRRNPLIAVGLVWFMAALAPSSSVIPLREVMAEHRLYLASAGFFAAAVSLVARPLATRAIARVAISLIVIGCVTLTIRRNVVWSSEIGVWREATARSGRWEAHYAYAEALREAGQCERAIPEYRAVLRLHADHEPALLGLKRCRP